MVDGPNAWKTGNGNRVRERRRKTDLYLRGRIGGVEWLVVVHWGIRIGLPCLPQMLSYVSEHDYESSRNSVEPSLEFE